MKEFFNNLLQKITSRKFLVCVAICGVGICMSLGVSSSEISEIIGMISTLLGGLTYVVTEAGLDKASMKVKEAEAKAKATENELKAAEVRASMCK